MVNWFDAHCVLVVSNTGVEIPVLKTDPKYSDTDIWGYTDKEEGFTFETLQYLYDHDRLIPLVKDTPCVS